MSSNIRTITHSASGASCQIHEHGACIVSYKTGAGRECLFLSNDAKLDGSKAIRGGIPLAFPIFGPDPNGNMPQHGFLRVNTWSVDDYSTYDIREAAGITYSVALKDITAARGGDWDEQTTSSFDCACKLHVKVEATKLVTTLEIQNTGDKSFPFQALQHTYLKVDGQAATDGSQCYVKGLEGYSVIDKVSKTEYPNGSDPITITGEVDRVYNPPSSSGNIGSVEVIVGVGQGKQVKSTAHGFVDGKQVPVSAVVWNPYIEKAASMSDFHNEGYKEMICVEPLLHSEPADLEGGKTAKLIQTLEML